MRNKKKQKKLLKCNFCANPPTYAVMLELRDRPGPPLKENNVIQLACDIHSVETSFDYWVPRQAFAYTYNQWKEVGIILKKQYCNIHFLKLQ